MQATTNNAAINIPADLDYCELYIECRYANNCAYKWHVTKRELTNNTRSYVQGFNDGDINYAIVNINSAQIQLREFWWKSLEIGGHCVTSVYYR